jgi:NTP pyrophosphatase (non-canonical NTP hydrolase)
VDFDEYQRKALETAIFKQKHYPYLGLANEVGEVLGHVKKEMRDGTALDPREIQAELGDVLWYVAAIADQLGIRLSAVAEINIEKLASRKRRNKIQGSGNHR